MPTTQDDAPDATSVDDTGPSDETSESDSDSQGETDTDAPMVCAEIGFAAGATASHLKSTMNGFFFALADDLPRYLGERR